MHGSDRDAGTASLNWFLPLLGIFLAVGLACAIGFLQARETERRQQTPATYRQGAKADAERACVGAETARMFECVFEKVEASHEQAQTDQDLSAQQRAASSGLASAVISFLTLIATGLGVWFVKRTLDATLQAVADTGEATIAMFEANKIAKEGVESQMRASIEIDSEIDPKRSRLGDQYIHGDVSFTNHGVTPAIGLSYLLGVSTGKKLQVEIDSTIDHFISGAIDWSDFIVFPNDKITRATVGENTNPKKSLETMHYFVVAVYKTAFSDTKRISPRAWVVHDKRRLDFLVNPNSPPSGDRIMTGLAHGFAGHAT